VSPFWFRGDTCLRERGWGGPNSDKGTDTVVYTSNHIGADSGTLVEVVSVVDGGEGGGGLFPPPISNVS
jgi:hypothetical protein